jgi:hypothetical protein
MKNATVTAENDKSLAKSISFFPSTIFHRAEKYAERQDPKRSTSSVVCEALSDFLAKNDPQPDDATTAAVAQFEAEAAKDATLAAEVLQFIRDRKRSRRSGR